MSHSTSLAAPFSPSRSADDKDDEANDGDGDGRGAAQRADPVGEEERAEEQHEECDDAGPCEEAAPRRWEARLEQRGAQHEAREELAELVAQNRRDGSAVHTRSAALPTHATSRLAA